MKFTIDFNSDEFAPINLEGKCCIKKPCKPKCDTLDECGRDRFDYPEPMSWIKLNTCPKTCETCNQ